MSRVTRRACCPRRSASRLLVAGSVLLTLGLVRGDDWGWTSAATVASIVGGVAVLCVFVAHQARTSAPAMDLSLFESHNFRWANAATIVFGIAFSAMFLSSILFLTSVWKWSILEAGFGVAPGPLLVALLAPRFGKLAARIGQRPLIVAGGLVYAAGGAWRLLTFDAEPAFLTAYLPSMLLTGTGVALCIPQLSSVIGQSLPPNRFGVGGAVNQALRQLGGTLGVAVAVGFVSGATGIDDALGRFERIWWMIVAGGVLTTLLSIPLRTVPRSAADPLDVDAGGCRRRGRGLGRQPMRRKPLDRMDCSIAKALDIVGDPWTMLILRDALLGVKRFESFSTRLGIPRATLSARLDHLCDRGVLEQRPLPGTARARRVRPDAEGSGVAARRGDVDAMGRPVGARRRPTDDDRRHGHRGGDRPGARRPRQRHPARRSALARTGSGHGRPRAPDRRRPLSRAGEPTRLDVRLAPGILRLSASGHTSIMDRLHRGVEQSGSSSGS